MSDDSPIVYAIRIMPIAHAEIGLHRARIAATRGETEADSWEAGLEETISHLATAPIRPLIAEQELFQNHVRQILYRERRVSVAYRVLYRMLDETPDGPQVQILSVRPAAAQPIQPYETRQIEGQLENS